MFSIQLSQGKSVVWRVTSLCSVGGPGAADFEPMKKPPLRREQCGFRHQSYPSLRPSFEFLFPGRPCHSLPYISGTVKVLLYTNSATDIFSLFRYFGHHFSFQQSSLMHASTPTHRV